MSWARETARTGVDLSRVRQQTPNYPRMGQGMALFKVINSALITSSDYRYLYTLKEAVVGAGPGYAPTLSVNNPTYYGVSVSELSNPGPTYSYGIQAANVPAGFVPVAIPNNSYVAGFLHYQQNGDIVVCIVNTQAIDGACT